MDKKKMIYIGSLLILTAIISIASFSYAIWSNKSEQRGKLNIVAGSLNYELVSDDLNNNSITIPANTNKTIEIEITSLNNIESKYELYYTTNNENISIGYSEETVDNPTGTISSRSSKKVTVIIKNRTDTEATITFGCQGGFSDKELILAQGNSITEQMGVCIAEPGDIFTFDYTGGEQDFEVPCDGYYKLETWGAQGGNVTYGGKGAYATGITQLSKSDYLYIVVGGTNSTADGGYNGGGSCTSNGYGNYYCNGGGGATHIANNIRNDGLLSNYSQNTSEILIVSGGGGGYGTNKNGTTSYYAGSGGGINGVNGTGVSGTYGIGATQVTAGTTSVSGAYAGATGSFGQGGSSTNEGAGGGGFYGGGASYGSGGSGGGGSGYIANPQLSNKHMTCYNCTTSNDINTKTISNTCVNITPTVDCSKTGNGYARITYLGEGNTTTLYSAAVDEVYYYDSNNNKQIIGTTDTTGKLENVFIPNNVTLYSTVAKNPSDLSNAYNETFNTIGNETYLMPEGNVVYWYGYNVGWDTSTAYYAQMSDRAYYGGTLVSIGTNYLSAPFVQSSWGGRSIVTQNKISFDGYSKYNIISSSNTTSTTKNSFTLNNTLVGERYLGLYMGCSNTISLPWIMMAADANSKQYMRGNGSSTNEIGTFSSGSGTGTHYVYAIWLSN